MRLCLFALCLAACGGGLIVEPTDIAFGEIDFNQPRPGAGYDPTTITVLHDGGPKATLVVRGVDAERVVLGAQLTDDDPPTLAPIRKGETALLTLGVWDYEAGEWDTEVKGSIDITADGFDDVTVTWSFTPVRDP